MIHRCVFPHSAEVDLGRKFAAEASWLFYDLLGHRQRPLIEGHRRPQEFRPWLDQCFRDLPELFPTAFAEGYTLEDSRTSKKTGLLLRRIECKATAETFSVRPSIVLPYMTGLTDDVEKALFLRSFGVPFWALARACGRDPMYWYRLEVSLGRNCIVGTTVRQEEVPEHLLADEHHQTLDVICMAG